jgi:hypothetical protein
MIHIRQPLPRKRGNNFYRDDNPRTPHTLCGAPVTDKDVNDTKGGLEWLRTHNGCNECAKKSKWNNR